MYRRELLTTIGAASVSACLTRSDETGRIQFEDQGKLDVSELPEGISQVETETRDHQRYLLEQFNDSGKTFFNERKVHNNFYTGNYLDNGKANSKGFDIHTFFPTRNDVNLSNIEDYESSSNNITLKEAVEVGLAATVDPILATPIENDGQEYKLFEENLRGLKHSVYDNKDNIVEVYFDEPTVEKLRESVREEEALESFHNIRDNVLQRLEYNF